VFQQKNFLWIFVFFILIWSIFVNLNSKSNQNNSETAKHSGEKIEIIGTIYGDIDIRENNTRIFIKAESIQSNRRKIFITENTIVTTSHFPKYKTGDKLKFYGKVQVPENFENENGIEFDYVNFLAKDNIYTNFYYPKIELLDRPKWHFNRQIFAIKNSFLEQIQRIIPSPESELLGGILLGTKRSLGKELENKFRIVGLIHIVVLSGYNITIIAEAIFRFFKFLPRKFSVGLSVASIIIFAIMVGSGATIIRATIMTLLAVFARISGKTYGVNRSLFFAGSIMLIHNPSILFHDPSFQLSFLATFGLINFADFVKKFLKWLPEKFEIREISTATLSTQIAVLPLLTKMTGEISVVAPIVNIMTLQIIPITMLFGFIAGLVTFISQPVGFFIGIIPYLFLKYILLIVDFFASLNFAVWVF
jgi:competence protein ComEC